MKHKIAVFLLLLFLFSSTGLYSSVDRDTLFKELSAIYSGSKGMQKAGGITTNPQRGSYYVRQLCREWKNFSEDEKSRFRTFLQRPSDATGSGIGQYTAAEILKELTWETTHFRIHYINDSSSSHAPSNFNTDSNFHAGVAGVYVDSSLAAKNAPDYVEKMADYFELTYAFYKASGFLPTAGGGEPVKADTLNTINGGNGKYDVYIMDIGRVYGVTISGSDEGDDYTSYIVMHKDYTSFGDADLSMLVTVFHEFFHGIQYSYNPDAESWWMEATAVFMEDELFIDSSTGESGTDWGGIKNGDLVNDYAQYLASVMQYPYLPLNYENSAHEYGTVLFAKFLSENYSSADSLKIIRETWVDLESTNNPVTAISNVLVNTYSTTLAAALKNYYLWLYFTGDRNPASSVGYGKNGRFWEEDDGNIGGVTSYDTVDVRTQHSDYPVGVQNITSYMPRNLSANYIEFFPDTPYGRTFELEFDGADKDTGNVSASWAVQVLLFKADGTFDLREMSLDSRNSGVFNATNFGTNDTYRKIVVMPVVTSTATSYTGFKYIYASFLGNVKISENEILDLYNYPNPTRDGNTTISYNLLKTSYVKLTVYDANGRKVRTLLTHQDGEQDAGFNPQSVVWNGTNDDVKQVANGIYFYKVEVERPGEGEVAQKIGKLVIIR